MKALLGSSRYLVLAAVFGALIAAAALFVYGLIDTVAVVWQFIVRGEVSGKGAKILMFEFIEVFDLFLLGTVLLIMALSLYEFFIDNDLKLPARLEINSFDDLKANLVTVVIVVLGVTFLGHVVAWDGEQDLLRFGIAVAVVIAALNLFLFIAKRGKK
jgi:uncharacterized membrane protein YqhA